MDVLHFLKLCKLLLSVSFAKTIILCSGQRNRSDCHGDLSQFQSEC
jgi:hypothetical protein